MKKRTKIILGGLFIILVMLNLTVPSEDDYYEWLEDEHNIKRGIGSHGHYEHTKDGVKLFNRGRSRTMYGIFTIIEEDFDYKVDGTLTVRTLGVTKSFFTMEKKYNMENFKRIVALLYY